MKPLTILLFLLVSLSAHASDYTSDIDAFFDLYKKGEVDKAIDMVYESNPYVSVILDQNKNVKA